MKKFFGVIFIIIGFLILVTPFTPGSILLVIGLDMVFGDRWPWWQRAKERLKLFFKRS